MKSHAYLSILRSMVFADFAGDYHLIIKKNKKIARTFFSSYSNYRENVNTKYDVL